MSNADERDAVSLDKRHMDLYGKAMPTNMTREWRLNVIERGFEVETDIDDWLRSLGRPEAMRADEV